jgi:cytochrome c553
VTVTLRRAPSARLGAVVAVAAGIAGGAVAQGGGGEARPRPASAPLCVACHGTNGYSTAPDAPHLAAQPAMYLAAQLKAFREGSRKHEVMNVVAKSLKDDDIEQLARWYSEFKIEVK